MEMFSAKLLQRRASDDHAVATPRDIVAAHMTNRLRGAPAAVAQRQTAAYYRASGHAWARALA